MTLLIVAVAVIGYAAIVASALALCRMAALSQEEGPQP